MPFVATALPLATGNVKNSKWYTTLWSTKLCTNKNTPIFASVKHINHFVMNRAFVYGMSVEGENFTDRVNETKRLKLDFENGINVILVSPRRMGKSSIVKKVNIIYARIWVC